MSGLHLVEPAFDGAGDSNYLPCRTGLHLCGAAAAPDSDYEQPYSALNLIASSADEARAMFAAAKEEAACSKDEEDFVCDLMIGGDVEADFYTNRQLTPRLVEAALRARAAGESA